MTRNKTTMLQIMALSLKSLHPKLVVRTRKEQTTD